MNASAPNARAPTRLLTAWTVAGLMLGLLVGCATPTQDDSSAPAPRPGKPTAASNPFDRLKKGLTAAEVRALVGEPPEIKPASSGGVRGETWVYRRLISQDPRPVAVKTEEVPQYNPFTGQTNMVAEPVTSYEFTTTTEVIELLMIEGGLAEWKKKRQVDRTINRTGIPAQPACTAPLPA